jgi:uncharacterized membrane protein YsdA (DUF1294 family)
MAIYNFAPTSLTLQWFFSGIVFNVTSPIFFGRDMKQASKKTCRVNASALHQTGGKIIYLQKVAHKCLETQYFFYINLNLLTHMHWTL